MTHHGRRRRHHLDDDARGDCDADAGGGERQREQRTGDGVAATVVAVEREQRAQSGAERDQPRDLERPQEVLPGRPQGEQERRRQQRGERPDAAARVDEEQRGATEVPER